MVPIFAQIFGTKVDPTVVFAEKRAIFERIEGRHSPTPALWPFTKWESANGAMCSLVAYFVNKCIARVSRGREWSVGEGVYLRNAISTSKIAVRSVVPRVAPRARAPPADSRLNKSLLNATCRLYLPYRHASRLTRFNIHSKSRIRAPTAHNLVLFPVELTIF